MDQRIRADCENFSGFHWLLDLRESGYFTSHMWRTETYILLIAPVIVLGIFICILCIMQRPVRLFSSFTITNIMLLIWQWFIMTDLEIAHNIIRTALHSGFWPLNVGPKHPNDRTVLSECSDSFSMSNSP